MVALAPTGSRQDVEFDSAIPPLYSLNFHVKDRQLSRNLTVSQQSFRLRLVFKAQSEFPYNVALRVIGVD